MFLTDDEVKELTGKSRRASQVKVLNSLGIIHKIRPDGSLLILRSHVEQLLGGKLTSREREEERQAKQKTARQREFEASLAAMRAEDEERARKRKAQQDAKKAKINQSRKAKGLPPLR